MYSPSIFVSVTGIDHALAQHIAHLFIRDPVILFSEKLHLNDAKDTDHFEVQIIKFSSHSHVRSDRMPEYQLYQLAIHAIQTSARE